MYFGFFLLIDFIILDLLTCVFFLISLNSLKTIKYYKYFIIIRNYSEK